jgi:CRISPR-associated protein Cas2
MSERRRVWIAYDIREPKRWRRVYRIVKGYGGRLQFSVFECLLSETQLAELREKLDPILDHAKDRLMIARLCPPCGEGVEFWGERVTRQRAGPLIV